MRAGFNALSLVDVNQVIKRLSGLTQRAVVSIGIAGATGA